ncbi:MAG: hypothetical protein IKC87_03055 [Clostridia bacterium]|nr:hypothetical protein [Clostridia bacterium]
MAKTDTSFKGFVDDYVKKLELGNRKKTFTEYVVGEGEHYNSTAGRAAEALLLKNAAAGMSTGRSAASLRASGLDGGGYEDYLREKVRENARMGLLDIEKTRKANETNERRKYVDYLEGFESKQDNVRRRVTSTLSQQRVIDPVRVYEYAVEAGLDDKNATEAVSAVYNAVRNQLKVEILSKINDHYFTPDMAASYARAIGLTEEDVKEIKKATERLQFEYAMYGSQYLDYLDKLGDTMYGGIDRIE